MVTAVYVIIGLFILGGFAAWAQLDGELSEPESVIVATLVLFCGMASTGYGAWRLGLPWGILVAVAGLFLFGLSIFDGELTLRGHKRPP